MTELIAAVDAVDVRFPTSRELDGSDALNPEPDYSATYVTVRGTPIASTTSRLRGVGSNRCLDVDNASTVAGATVLIWDCHTAGSTVILWACSNQSNQRWGQS